MLDSWHLLSELSTSLPSSSSFSLVSPVLLFFLPPLQVALSIKGGGEGHVVEGPGDGVGPRVGGHAGNAVLCLVWGKLPPQLVRCDEVLMENKEDGTVRTGQYLHVLSTEI